MGYLLYKVWEKIVHLCVKIKNRLLTSQIFPNLPETAKERQTTLLCSVKRLMHNNNNDNNNNNNNKLYL